ncbi:MAG: hypothetical protein HYZ75_17075 [Elusimicrobia bacterium]|nr:hypothetical protein [Elusimicrobiota bacterium]
MQNESPSLPVLLLPPWRVRAVKAAALLLALCAGTVHAAFQEPVVTPQASAMGGASLASDGDSAALFLNAAAPAGLKGPEAYLMYNQLYAGLEGAGSISQGFAAFGFPTKAGVVGVGLSDFRASSLLEERAVALSLARSLSRSVKAGITAKYLYHRYMAGSDPLASADPVFAEGTSRGAPAFDLGVIVSLTGALQAGMAVRNFNEPEMGLRTQDRVPREFQAGLAYDFKDWGLRLTGDYAHRNALAGTLSERGRPGVGLEKSLQDGRVRFRAGATPDQFSAGIGLRFSSLGLDYAFKLSRNLISDNAGTHLVGIRYSFGGKDQ